MRWNPGHRSVNVEDRRGAGGGFMRGAGGMGAGGLIILVILSLIFGRDFVSLASDPGVAPGAESGEAPPAETTPEEERMVSFVSFVLDDAQKTWRGLSSETGTPYRDAKLVLFRDAVQSACGFAESATGPFYCPADEKVYIDLGFYEELQQRFGAPGDFAQAYVLAHEIGHHVQNLLGTEEQVREARTRRADRAQRAVGPARAPGRLLRRRLGHTTPRSGSGSSRAMSRRVSARPRRSETTAYSVWAAAESFPSPSPTEPPPSVRSGSSAAWRPAARTPATPSGNDLAIERTTASHRMPARRGAAPHLVHDETLDDAELEIAVLGDGWQVVEVEHDPAAEILAAAALHRPVVLPNGGGVVEPDLLPGHDGAERDEHPIVQDTGVGVAGVVQVAARGRQIQELRGSDLERVDAIGAEREHLGRGEDGPAEGEHRLARLEVL